MKICISCGKRHDGSGYKCPVCGTEPKFIGRIPLFSPELAMDNDGFKQEFFEELFFLEGNSFWFVARNKLISWVIRKYFSQVRNMLEIGCGTGYVLSGIKDAFPGMSLYGSEIFLEGLKFADKRLSDVNLLQMDARYIPFEQEFDLIGIFDVLEHIDEEKTVLEQTYRAVKPGGGIILTVPQHKFLWSKHDELACHVRRYERKTLNMLIEKSGFKVERVTSFVSLLFPLIMFSRLNKKRRNNDPCSEYAIPGFINTVFQRIMSIERMLIERGVDFKWGSSLLVVAKKVRVVNTL